MAYIERKGSGQRIPVESDHLVGRSHRCTLRLDDERVSNEHASIRWTGEQWLLKDLGSLNRTTVDGHELPVTTSVVLTAGAQISFGHPDQTWILADDSAPGAIAIPDDGGAAVPAIDGLLALPSADDPQVTIHRDRQGAWGIENDGATQPIADQAPIQVGGRQFRVCLPQVPTQTAPVQGFFGKRIADVSITFRVSADLEHIELEVIAGGDRHRFGARTHNEMLLILARTRKQDALQGIPSPSCGWMYQDDLCRKAAVDPARLNVDVYRIRRQFAELGLLDPASIVERRSKARQVRIGTGNLEEIGI